MDDTTEQSETPEQVKKNARKEALAKKKAEEKAKLRKKRMIQAGVLGFIAFISYGYYALSRPQQGSMAYGLCKVFLEQGLTYPLTLRVNTVEEFAGSVRIWYTHTDAFGEYKLEPMQCYFIPDEKTGFALDRVTVRRQNVPTERIRAFNQTLSIILANPPDLTLPWPLPDSLKGLQIETNMFRNPLF